MIRNIGNLINREKGIEGFRKINVYPGDNASFTPVIPYQIYPYLYSLIDNYYNVWNLLDPFLREAMFHINFMRIHPFEDENEPLGQQKTYLQKYLQNKGFTDFGKSFF